MPATTSSPLGVHEIIAVEDFFAGAGVARKAYSGARGVAGVAKDHLDNVNGGAEQAGNFFNAAVGDRLLRHPGTEYRADRAPELLHGIIGKAGAGFFTEVDFVFGDKFLPAAGRNRSVFLDTEAILHAREGGAPDLPWTCP